jgi:hypothetical protein
MPIDVEELLQEIYASMVRAAPGGWKRVELIAVGMGASTGFRNASFSNIGSRTSLPLDSQGTAACAKLREVMFREGKGTWCTGTFAIDSSGERDAQYDYTSAPLNADFAETLADIRDELIEDQKLFPRDQEHLPEWHPSRDRLNPE